MTMAGLRVLFSLIVSLGLAIQTYAYSSGGPDGACDSLVPSHGAPPQNGQAPYQVTTSKNTIGPGEQIDVTVSGGGGGPFKGFFIRARQNNNFLAGGQFQPNSQAQLRCNGQGITHNSPGAKNSVTVTWTAPSNLGSSPVQFVATVVQQRTVFWTSIPSPDVAVGAPSGGATPPAGNPTTPGSGTMPTGSGGAGQSGSGSTQTGGGNDDDDDDNENGGNIMKNPGAVVVDSECGKTKGCYHNCRDGGPCTYSISWLYSNETVLFQFLFQPSSRTDQWIALGLSNDKYMGDDSVMECVMEGGQVLVKVSYNSQKFNVYPDDKHAAISEYGGSMKDGVLACNFRRKMSYPREPRVFDLHKSYYLMVAFGEAVSGNKFPHSYEKPPKVSSDKIDFRHYVSIKSGLDPLYPMVKTHGTAMTLAWMLFSSIGVFVARHGKEMFNNSKPCGIKVWFHIHRFCMGMTAFLTTAGFILILVESKGYSHIPETSAKPYRTLHPPLGLILVILTIVNPLMALFRPDHDSPSRPVFNWLHWGCGILAWLISFVLLVIGLDLHKSQSDVEAIYVVFAFIGYQLVIDIFTRAAPVVLGGVWGWLKKGCCRNKNSYDFNMTEFSSHEVPSITGNGIAPNKEMAEKEQEEDLSRENSIRSAFLVFHMMASACFAVAVLYFFLRRPIESLSFNSDTSLDDASE